MYSTTLLIFTRTGGYLVSDFFFVPSLLLSLWCMERFLSIVVLLWSLFRDNRFDLMTLFSVLNENHITILKKPKPICERDYSDIFML